MQKMGIPSKQLHSYDYGGPYAGFRGAINFYREIDRLVNTRIWSFIHAALGEGKAARARSHVRYARDEGEPTMLLRHTTAEVVEREALTVNPAKTCQPIGAMYAALGIHNCLPHSHGSQGCCSYHRSTLTRHYKEPVMAVTSSFTEGSSVFGGQANLLQAITNIFAVYNPDVIAVHTTCLSETIGDDIPQIIAKARDEGKIPAGQARYPRQHAQLRRLARDRLLQHGQEHGRLLRRAGRRTRRTTINLIPGWVEPSDMREIKRLAAELGVDDHRLPRHVRRSGRPADRQARFYPKGGVTIEAACPHRGQPGHRRAGADRLRGRREATRHQVQSAVRVAGTAHRAAGHRSLRQHAASADSPAQVPPSINDQRGRLMDMITDMHQYFHGVRVALWGDPDQLVSLAEFLTDLDMRPVYIVTGTPGKQFDKRMEAALAGRVPEAKFRQGAGADMFLMHQWIKQEPVDLLIGNTYGKYIARDENIPFVRHGFPIMDRVGHSYFPTVGYRGAMRLLEMILNALLDHKDRTVAGGEF